MNKLGNIPDGGGWPTRVVRRGRKNRAATPGKPRNVYRNLKMRTAFVYTELDDHSHIAHAETHDDEKAEIATLALRHATTWFVARGVPIECVLSDNDSAHRFHTWCDVCREFTMTPKRTRPYQP